MELQSDIDTILRTHKGNNGISLYDHLLNVFLKLQQNKYNPTNFPNFEKISDFVKNNTFTYKNPLPDKEVNIIKENRTELTEWINRCQAILNPVPKKPFTPIGGNLPNIVAESRLYELAGVYFGEEETYLLSKAVQRLMDEKKAKQIRFWGKILGSVNDYYIAEGEISNKTIDDPQPNTENQGQGVNALIYWVTTDVLGEWVRLPVVSAEQIKTSRLIKHIFTGDLNASIHSYPFFNGKEKHLLKCMVVRISNSTTLAPKDYYKLKEVEGDEDPLKTKDIELNPDFAWPAFEDLKNPENWSHLLPNITKAGRVNHLEPVPKNAEENVDDLKTTLLEADPIAERLKGINEDQSPIPPPEGADPPPQWTVKTVGDPQVFNMVDRDDGQQTNYSLIVIKSVLWPGSLTVYQNKVWSSIYVGYGFKNESLPFNPTQPTDVIDDPEDLDEFPEPNPKNPPPEPLEPDTDKPLEDGEGADAE